MEAEDQLLLPEPGASQGSHDEADEDADKLIEDWVVTHNPVLTTGSQLVSQE